MNSSNNTFASVWLIVIGVPLIYYAISSLRWRARTRGLPLPPGPKALPVIGNLSSMNELDLWLTHRELCKTYGDIVHLSVFGQNIVTLGSIDAIHDLLKKRSAVTSDRQKSVIIPLIGHEFNIAFMPYGSRWRRHRQALSQCFTSGSEPYHLDAQRHSALMFARKLLADPSGLREHIEHTFSASILKVAYGIKAEEQDDKNIILLKKVLECLTAFTPGRYLVQYLPGVQSLPHWLPVIGSQLRELASMKAACHEAKDVLFKQSMDVTTHDNSVHSILSSIVERSEKQCEATLLEEYEIANNVALTAFEGGADTTFAVLQFFFLAMVLYPDVQKRAQAELDAIVGSDRLPSWEDRNSLPYLNALIKEVLRWQNVAPFGFPHYTTEDIEYRGYFIPKGTLLFPQIWTMMHDPEVYPEPDRFDPERFLINGKLNADVRDPSDFIFGFGRRTCPGKHFADAGQFIIFATILHTFAITAPLDESGNAIRISAKIRGVLPAFPEDLRCTIQPRNEQRKNLILATYDS